MDNRTYSQPCERIRFKAITESTVLPDSDQAQIELKFLSFEYFVIEETYVWTTEDLIGAFGGILGLWVGLNFVFLISFFFQPFIWLLEKCLERIVKQTGARV